MREVLFRGKRKYNGEWVYGNYCGAEYLTSDGIEHLIIEVPRSGSSARVLPETVGQYTGLTDKNGKKIFEGDIVKATITSNMEIGDYTKADIGVVGYDNIGVLGIVKYYDNGVPVWSDIIHELELSGAVIDYSFEVIGNIHDNPELLKGGAE